MSNGNSEGNRFLHLPHWQYPFQLPGLTGLYLNNVFRTLAFGLIGIFTPVFIFQNSGNWQGILIYYSIESLIVLGWIIPAAKLIRKFGPDKLVGLATITQALAILFLIKIQDNPNYLFAAAVFSGLTAPLHWLSYHLAFCSESDRLFLTKQLANNAIIGRLTAALAPFIGGVIATIFGFSSLYLIACGILVFSALPVFFDQYNQNGEKLIMGNIKKVFLNKSNRPLWLGFFGQGIESGIYGVIWPLYLYSSFRNFEKMGLLSTLSVLIPLFALGYIGKKSRKRERKFFRSGLMISLPNWILRSFSNSFIYLSVVDIIYQISTIFMWIPVNAVTYRTGRKYNKPFFVIRMIMIHLGILLSIIISGAVINLGWSYSFAFIIATLGLILIKNFYHGLKKNRRSFGKLRS